jgi:hypothetical protein
MRSQQSTEDCLGPDVTESPLGLWSLLCGEQAAQSFACLQPWPGGRNCQEQAGPRDRVLRESFQVQNFLELPVIPVSSLSSVTMSHCHHPSLGSSKCGSLDVLL